jgi:Tol biopolymer transport system component
MSPRSKKILLVIGFVLSVFAFAFALYFMFFRATPPAPASIEETVTVQEQNGELPSSIIGQIQKIRQEAEKETGKLEEADTVARGGVTTTKELTTSAIYNTAISSDGFGINYYNEADGKFYSINSDGEVVSLSDRQFMDAQNVKWNHDSQKALVEFPDGTNVVYDFKSQQQVTLPKHWEDFDFSPVADEIAAKSIALDPENRWIVISSDDGSRVKTIQALGTNEDKVDINWSPNDQVVAFADTAPAIEGGVDRKIIYPVGKNKENFKGLVVEGLNFDAKWSPNGKQLLYSVSGDYSDNKPLLWIVDATASTMGENRASLGLNTWVDKCTWSTQTSVYCAVPMDLPPNSGLGRSLYLNNPDALYKINLTTGRTNLVAIPDQSTPMNNLTISNNESFAYFTNKNGRLEVLKLK